MPYYDDLYGSEDADFSWEQLKELFETIKREIKDWKIETEEDARNEVFFELTDRQEEKHLNYSIVRFRETDDRPMLLGFHEIALTRLSIVEQLIEDGEFTPNLLYHWGILTACHGYLLNSSLALSTDLIGDVNRKKAATVQSIDAQLKWYVHWYAQHVIRRKMSPHKSNQKFRAAIFGVIDGDIPTPDGFSKEWFGRCLAKFKDGKGEHDGTLTAAMRKLSPRGERFTNFLRSDPNATPRIPPVSLGGLRRNRTNLGDGTVKKMK